MPHALYVCLQDDNKIAAFGMDSDTGQLSPRAEVPVAGGPSVMAVGPDRQMLYVGTRTPPAISTYQIDQGTGGARFRGTAPTENAPTVLSTHPASKDTALGYYQ